MKKKLKLSFFLLIFAQVAFSQLEDQCSINRLNVCLNDPDTTGTNMRKSPGGEIITSIKNDPSPMVELFIMFQVCEMEGDWLKVKTVNYSQELSGWIHNTVIGANLAVYSELEPIIIYSRGRISSEVVDKVFSEQTITILESSGNFSKIKYKSSKGKVKTGWVKNNYLCGNPYTTCC
jgi:hypothetical protein